MTVSIERKIFLGFVASALALAIVSAVAVWTALRMEHAFLEVGEAYRTLDRLDTARGSLLAMQAAGRGYALSGNEDVLSSHHEAEHTLRRSLEALGPADGPGAIDADLAALRAAADRARSIIQERIESRRLGGVAAAHDRTSFMQAHEAVESFRRRIDGRIARERAQLDESIVRSRAAADAAVAAIAGASLAAIGLGMVALRLVRRDLRLRREAEAERDRFFTVSRDLLAIAGFDGRFKRLNPAWRDALGFTIEELLARPYLEFVHPDDRARTAQEAARIEAGEETVSFENRFRHRDGSHRWLLWSARPVPAERIIVASARDITRRKEADERIHALNAQLAAHAEQVEAANRELEAFSYSVSHDLRAPLRHIDGFSSLLTQHMGDRLDEQGRRYLDTISRAARNMGTLIDDLLAFSRVSRTTMRVERVDSDALVAAVIAEGGYAAASPAIAWHIAPLPAVEADASLVRQVWFNLIDNAVKYSSKSPAPEIWIETRHDASAGEYVFSVRDNGVGFDMAYADKLFGVFQRLHTPAEFHGTGIGLANVQRIVGRHGGRTWAEGKVREGATFFFSLPDSPSTARAPA